MSSVIDISSDSSLEVWGTAEPAPELVIEDSSSTGIDYEKYPLPSIATFTSIYAIYLRDPYSYRQGVFREYRDWVLAPSLYVLNTFSRFDTDILLRWYLANNPPADWKAIHALQLFLGEIDLTVPAFYEIIFMDFLRSLEGSRSFLDSSEKKVLDLDFHF